MSSTKFLERFILEERKKCITRLFKPCLKFTNVLKKEIFKDHKTSSYLKEYFFKIMILKWILFPKWKLSNILSSNVFKQI